VKAIQLEPEPESRNPSHRGRRYRPGAGSVPEPYLWFALYLL